MTRVCLQSSEPGQADGMDVTDFISLPPAHHYMIDVTSFTFKNQSMKLELKLVKGLGTVENVQTLQTT